MQSLRADAHRPKRERRTARALYTEIKAAGCLVSVARNRYSVPCELAGQMVSTRLYPGRVVVVAGDAIVASHERLGDESRTCYDWQHYIPLLQRGDGAAGLGAAAGQNTARCGSRDALGVATRCQAGGALLFHLLSKLYASTPAC